MRSACAIEPRQIAAPMLRDIESRNVLLHNPAR
jgi:hypothetical protein